MKKIKTNIDGIFVSLIMAAILITCVIFAVKASHAIISLITATKGG